MGLNLGLGLRGFEFRFRVLWVGACVTKYINCSWLAVGFSQLPLAPRQAPDDQAKELAEKLTDRNPNRCSAQGQVGQVVSAQDAWLGCLVCG